MPRSVGTWRLVRLQRPPYASLQAARTDIGLAETGIGRYKAAIGPQLRARILSGQQGEVALAVEVQGRNIRAASRWLKPSTWQAWRTRAYSSAGFIITLPAAQTAGRYAGAGFFRRPSRTCFRPLQ